MVTRVVRAVGAGPNRATRRAAGFTRRAATAGQPGLDAAMRRTFRGVMPRNTAGRVVGKRNG